MLQAPFNVVSKMKNNTARKLTTEPKPVMEPKAEVGKTHLEHCHADDETLEGESLKPLDTFGKQ